MEAGVEPRPPKRPPAAGAGVEVALVVLVGAAVAAGLAPKREGMPPVAADSAGLGVDDAAPAPPNMLGVEVAAVLPPVAPPPNRSPGF